MVWTTVAGTARPDGGHGHGHGLYKVAGGVPLGVRHAARPVRGRRQFSLPGFVPLFGGALGGSSANLGVNQLRQRQTQFASFGNLEATSVTDGAIWQRNPAEYSGRLVVKSSSFGWRKHGGLLLFLSAVCLENADRCFGPIGTWTEVHRYGENIVA